MPDREKIINQIDVDIQRAERTGEMLVHIGRKTAKDALSMLKEQPQIVRCRDCKHRPKETNEFDLEFPEGSKCPCQCSDDEYYSWYPEDDWFCADGERKNDNA